MKRISHFLNFCSFLAFACFGFLPFVTAQDQCIQNIRVNAGGDDAEESGNGSGNVSLTSTDLEMTFDGERGYQTVGLRFNDLQIPNGAVVSNAYIQFTAERVNVDVTDLTIRGQNADNAGTFNAADFDISTRELTTASVVWSPPAWNIIGEAGADQRTVDLSAIVQEIVNRAGWAAGNSIVLILTGAEKRTAYAYDGDPAAAPLLHVEFTGDANGCPEVETPCDDEDPTTEDVVDIDGVCRHFKKVCDDGDPRTRDFFDEEGACVSEPIVCDDGDPETEDSLDDNGVCHHLKTISECDECPDDPDKMKPGQCGCGNPDTDTDGDGTADCVDWCPEDPDKTEDGQCGCDVPDTDTDGDGTPDCNDWCPDDPNKTDDGHCGCGNPEPGTPCDDGDECTKNDKITEDCECKGRPKDTPECNEDPCPGDADDLCEECPEDLEGCEKFVKFVACDKVIVCAGKEVSNIIVDLGPTGFQSFDVDLKFGDLAGKRWTYVSPNGEKINGVWVKTDSECDRCHEDEEMYGCVDCEGAACPEGDKAGPYYGNNRCECNEEEPADRDEDGIPDCADICPNDPDNECDPYACPELEDCEKAVFFPACDKVVVCSGEKISEIVIDLGRTGFQNYFIDRKFKAIHGNRWEYKAPWGLTINGVWVKTKGRCAECHDDDDFSCEDCDGAACPRGRDGGRYYENTQEDCRRPYHRRDHRVDINIFPNPTSRFIHIILGHIFNRRGSLEILNSNGVRVHREEINEWNADNLKVDMRNEPKGLYFLRVVLEDGEVLVKQFVLAD